MLLTSHTEYVMMYAKQKEESMKVNTVNVIEYASDAVIGVRSFQDDEEGGKEAEALFQECVRENCIDNVLEAEMLTYIEEGYFEQGDYQVFVTHSS